ncbi:MAG TPA: DNA-3-methyladenine glycosylase 2 family protein [Actinomycetota bacterium]
MASRLVRVSPIDLALTLGPMWRGNGDPTMRVERRLVERASRTPEGPVAARFVEVDGGIEVEAWGPGASWLLEHAPSWCGALDAVDGFHPTPGPVREIHRRHAGLRIPRTGLVTERLIPVILEQKVTSIEARRAYRRLATALAEPAPGPLGLTLPPDPARVAALPSYTFHPFGVEARRAHVLREVGRRAAWVDAAADLRLEEATRRLRFLRGIGPWTVAEVARTALGDADAVSVGDYHMPNIVSWALAREPRGSDERMLELLEPYRPHRGRVYVLLKSSGIRAPAYGPRNEPAAIDRI